MIQKKQLGFTLIEIILALSILSSIGFLTIHVLSQQIDIRKKITDQNTAQRSLNVSLQLISHDLQGAYLFDPNNQAILNLSARQVIPQFYFQSGNLVFSIRSFYSYKENAPESDLAVVRYFVRPDPKDARKNQLVRVVDTQMAQNIENSNVGFLSVFVQNLKEFSVTFWNGTEFVQQWDSRANQTQNKLPKLVKIYLSKYIQEDENASVLQTAQKPFLEFQTVVFMMGSLGQSDPITPALGNYKWD
jgi:prepilin-type N-terminal cleavage/methylation domain-containing protein